MPNLSWRFLVAFGFIFFERYLPHSLTFSDYLECKHTSLYVFNLFKQILKHVFSSALFHRIINEASILRNEQLKSCILELQHSLDNAEMNVKILC